MTAVHLFVGQLRRIDDEGQWTGIFKTPVNEPLWLSIDGFANDAQADRRVHGGPEKAVHHYPVEYLGLLATRFPAIAEQLRPGSIGENVSTAGWTQESVCIGDIFSLGNAIVQVSQPRSPCWKIDKRYGTPGIATYIAENGLTGWYYRVLQSGDVSPESTFQLVERSKAAVSLQELLALWSQHRPDPQQLIRISQTPGLNAGWQIKLRNRVDWLNANTCN